MAKQIYYSTSLSRGSGGVYSLYGAEPYPPTAVGSSRYSTDGTAFTGAGERVSYVYTTQGNGLRAPGTEIPGVGIYAAGKIGAGLNLVSLRGVDGLGLTTTANAESKRSAEALYNQSTLAHSTIGPSDALLSPYSLVKRPKLISASHLPMYPHRPGEKDCVHYMLTRTCKFGEACKFDHPVWVPEGGIPDWKESVELSVKSELPERPLEAVCTFYAKTGKCKFGANCKFHHPKDIQLQSTGKYTGYPEKNESATNNADAASGDIKHAKTFIPFSPASLHNSKGLPIRPGETDCPFYLKTGSCKYGAACRYSHPDRIFINPTHTANLSNTILTPPVSSFPIGVINPTAAFIPSIDPRLAQVGVTVYPQRPGEMECDYYMRNGHCKFVERCKYHHPVDRSAPTAASGKPTEESVRLTLAGLPRREGSAVCPFYMKTGACKFGVACRFDHPPPGEAIAMAQVGIGMAAATDSDSSDDELEDDTSESSE